MDRIIHSLMADYLQATQIHETEESDQFERFSHEAEEDDFDAGAEIKKIKEAGGPVSQPGDAWQLGDHILICGDPSDPAVYTRLMGSEHAQCAITSPPIDPKEYARDGIAPWLRRMAGIIRLMTDHADIICWQIGDLAKTGSQFIEPMAVHSVSLFADQNLRPLWIRVWKMTGKDQNDAAVKNGNDRILAAYKNSGPKAWKIWIITEWDRSYTTILFPDEY